MMESRTNLRRALAATVVLLAVPGMVAAVGRAVFPVDLATRAEPVHGSWYVLAFSRRTAAHLRHSRADCYS